VTGERILVGMSEAQERAIDKQVAPHQFSQDLGPVQDASLNQYVSGLGARMQTLTQRPTMPYSYRVLNANYVNAYTFPGGAMGVTRGIMTELSDEAELAALLGHELGHVNARHAAQRQGQGMLAQAAVVGIGAVSADSPWGQLATIGSQIGASALLASYSRDNEREADALGQSYMVKAGYPASGMTDLHALLVREEKETPSLLQTMFSSHPMSGERLATARRLADTQYADSLKANPQRERYMDSTARLRHLKPAIDACKNGEVAMAGKKLPEAEAQFRAQAHLARLCGQRADGALPGGAGQTRRRDSLCRYRPQHLPAGSAGPQACRRHAVARAQSGRRVSGVRSVRSPAAGRSRHRLPEGREPGRDG
jgi:predicted Zn-dependent protease